MPYRTELALAAWHRTLVTIAGVTYAARPVSVPVLLRALQLGRSGDHLQILQGEDSLLRAAFPRVGWWRADPVRLIQRAGVEVRRAMMEKITSVPFRDEKPDASSDMYAAQREHERKAVRPAGDGPVLGPTLAIAAATCRSRFGETWYFNPERWPTSDGYVPHTVAWADYAALIAIDARIQLDAVVAHTISQSGKAARPAVEALNKAAYPIDPLFRPTSMH